ncbi:MAG: DUF3047 domain-containing protein [Rudaea sp.]
MRTPPSTAIRVAASGLLLLYVGVAPGVRASTTLRFSDASPGSTLPAGWLPYRLSRRHAMAQISVVRVDSTNALHIDADHAAGAIAHKLDLPAATVLNWQWKIDHSVVQADLAKKQGDDFAARVYVFFDLPRSALSFGARMKLRLAHMLFGFDLPTAALCYVWDNRHSIGTIAPNAFYSGVKTVVLQSGNALAGKWQVQRRDLGADFRAAFDRPAPRVTGIALASDTDNTGGHVNAWFGDIWFVPAAANNHAHVRAIERSTR